MRNGNPTRRPEIEGLIPLAIAAFNTEHFLKSDDVCIDMLEHIEDSFRTDTAIEPTTLMNVVGCDAQT
jgi:hypothetical protein